MVILQLDATVPLMNARLLIFFFWNNFDLFLSVFCSGAENGGECSAKLK